MSAALLAWCLLAIPVEAADAPKSEIDVDSEVGQLSERMMKLEKEN